MRPMPATTRSSPGLPASLEPQSLRSEADAARIRALPSRVGPSRGSCNADVLTGGATAVLEGWRSSTVDIDVCFEPDSDAALQRIAVLKEELSLNVELASPLDFLPGLEG